MYSYTVDAYRICFTENSNRTYSSRQPKKEEREKEKQANANTAQLSAAYMRACVRAGVYVFSW